MEEPPLEKRVSELERQLALLQSSVRDVQEEYGREVRTQRVTVVDEAGVQRVVLSAEHQTGSVLVQLAGGRRELAAELYSSEDPESGVPEAGGCLIKGGNVVTSWRLT